MSSRKGRRTGDGMSLRSLFEIFRRLLGFRFFTSFTLGTKFSIVSLKTVFQFQVSPFITDRGSGMAVVYELPVKSRFSSSGKGHYMRREDATVDLLERGSQGI